MFVILYKVAYGLHPINAGEKKQVTFKTSQDELRILVLFIGLVSY